MLNFLRAGGIPMIIVISFGLITLFVALRHFWAPSEHRILLVKTLSVATTFSVGAAVTANLAVVMTKVPNHPQWSTSPKLPLIVMTGIGEALTPAVLGFTMLSVSWIFLSSGIRKL